MPKSKGRVNLLPDDSAGQRQPQDFFTAGTHNGNGAGNSAAGNDWFSSNQGQRAPTYGSPQPIIQTAPSKPAKEDFLDLLG